MANKKANEKTEKNVLNGDGCNTSLTSFRPVQCSDPIVIFPGEFTNITSHNLVQTLLIYVYLFFVF